MARKRKQAEDLSLFDAPLSSSEPAPAGRKEALNEGQRKALNLTANRAISASAGTGKTFTLTALYTGLLTGRLKPGEKYLSVEEWLAKAAAGMEPLKPADVVAVTFTVKAAAELRERAQKALEEELKQSDIPDNLRKHLLECAHSLHAAPVTTIDSFCAQWLRRSGADAPVPAAFTVLAQDEADEMLEAALSAAAGELLESKAHPILEELAASWGIFTQRSGLAEVGRSLLTHLRSRGLSPSFLRRGTNVKALTLNSICAKFKAVYDAVPGAKNKGNSKPKQKLRDLCAVGKLPKTLSEARLIALELHEYLKPVWVSYNNIENPCRDILYAANAPYVEVLATYLDAVERKYTQAKRAAGGVDFGDLLLASRELIKAQAEINGASAYKFVLIDEFQDTNPLQKDVLWNVAFGGSEATRDSKLCIVGDVKQSIYRFRGADVSLMEHAADGLLTSELRENYRSRAKVIEFINAFCAQMWPGPAPAFHYDESHHLKPQPEESRHIWSGKAGEVIVWDEGSIGNAEEHRMRQARAIAQRIRALVEPSPNSELARPLIFEKDPKKEPRKEVRFGDVAILARSLKNLRQPLELELGRYHIPFQMMGGLSFYTRQEVIDCINVWACACDPGDDYAVTGLLRSPFVGLRDEGLWRLAECCAPVGAKAPPRRALGRALLDGEFVAREIVAPKFTDQDAATLKRASDLLRDLNAMLGRRTAVEILDCALQRAGYLAVLAIQPRGEVAVAAVRKTIELARAHETRGNKHLSDFVRWLRAQSDAEWDNPGASGGPDISSELPPGVDAVSIGTIHSAKGLEFPIVIIPEMGAKEPSNSEAAIFTEANGLGLKIGAYFEGLDAHEDTVHFQNASIEKEGSEAESKRKLYVALTRAREYLIMLGEEKTGHGDWRKQLDIFRQSNPEILAEVPANHPELTGARSGSSTGAIEFADGIANLSKNAPAPRNQPLRVQTPLAFKSAVQTSVSRLAHWLWCPRQTAFEALEENEDSSRSGRLASRFEEGEVSRDEEESEIERPEASALGTAVHAALEILFGAAEPASPETEAQAVDAFARQVAFAEDHPEIKAAFERALALARSEWGRGVAKVPVAKRFAERPFRWRVDLEGGELTLSGVVDLLIQRGDVWEVVDYKFAASDSPASLARYAWQAGIYAHVAAEILKAAEGGVVARLAFLNDSDPQPRTLKELGHSAPNGATIVRALRAFGAAAGLDDPMLLPAQVWTSGHIEPIKRTRERCSDERCPFVSRCFGG